MRPPGPRLTTGRLKALVLLIALDVGIIKAIAPPGGLSNRLADLIVCGPLPMANVLAVGLVILLTPGRGGPAIRPSLLGIEVAGATAMCLCLLGALVATDSMYRLLDYPLDILGLRPGPLKGATALLLCLLPQVAVGLFGARVNRRSWLAKSATLPR